MFVANHVATRLLIQAGLLALLTCGALAFAQQEEPLPIVSRSRPANGYVFDRSSLVVLVRITEEIKAEIPNDEPGFVTTVTDKPSYATYVKALLLDPLRKPGPFLEGRRLRVLSKGGPLDAYDGRLFEDLEKELREHR